MAVLLLLSLFFGSISANSKPWEFVLIVSGSDEFGAHARGLFDESILEISNNVLGQLAPDVDRGITFAHTDQKEKWSVLAPLTKNTTAAVKKLNDFMQTQPDVGLSTSTGLAGSITFCLEKIFSKQTENVKIVLMLLHEEVLPSEIEAIFGGRDHDARRQVMLFLMVFPWPGAKCSSAKKTIKNIEKFHPEGVFCANDKEQFSNMPQIINSNMNKYIRIQKFLHPDSTTARAKVTFEYNLFGEDEAEEEEEAGTSCEGVACYWWLIAIGCIALLAIICTIPVFINNAIQSTRPRPATTPQPVVTKPPTKPATLSVQQLDFTKEKSRKKHSLMGSHPSSAQATPTEITTKHPSLGSGSSEPKDKERRKEEKEERRRSSAQNRRVSSGHHKGGLVKAGRQSSQKLLLPKIGTALRKISSATNLGNKGNKEPEFLNSPSPPSSGRSSQTSLDKQHGQKDQMRRAVLTKGLKDTKKTHKQMRRSQTQGAIEEGDGEERRLSAPASPGPKAGKHLQTLL